MWKATLDKKMLDKIYVERNEQMTEVIDWVHDNMDRIMRVIDDNPDIPFPSYPMDSGLVWMEEEGIHFTFEVLEHDFVELVWYANEYDFPIFKFKTVLRDREVVVRDLVFQDVPKNNYLKQDLLFLAAAIDETPLKTVRKFVALMFFMLFHEGEVIKVDASKSETRSKREVRKIKSKTGKVVPLVKKTYIIGSFDPKKTKVAGAPRDYTKPDHEVAVRGHYRHLKSGKVIWVKESTRYKDKGKKQPKTYKL